MRKVLRMRSPVHPNGGVRYDDDAPWPRYTRKLGDASSHGRENRPGSLVLEAEQYDATVPGRRMPSDVSYSLVQREEDTLSAAGGHEDTVIGGAGQTLLGDGIDVVAHRREILSELGGQVLVEL